MRPVGDNAVQCMCGAHFIRVAPEIYSSRGFNGVECGPHCRGRYEEHGVVDRTAQSRKFGMVSA